jgi:hypothetical protein
MRMRVKRHAVPVAVCMDEVGAIEQFLVGEHL